MLTRKKGLFSGNKWTRLFVVLSNVGLLYFKDALEAPVDLFPVIDCELKDVNPEEVDGDLTVFRLEYSRKQVTFKCSSLSECNSWTKAILKLKEETMSRRKTMKTWEMARITELQKPAASMKGNVVRSEVAGMSSFRQL